MTLIIVLNAVLCSGVIVAVASPLLWAIFTQHRDHSVTVACPAHLAGVSTRQECAPTPRQRREVAVA